MKTPDPTKAESSAPNSANSTGPRFTERQHRALCALWVGPVMREHLDAAAGCSNAPDLISQLRSKGVLIDMEFVDSIDRDGRPCRPGRYSLAPGAREALAAMGWAPHD
jgi:hypothetical protein